MTKAKMQDLIKEAVEKEHRLDERCITSWEWAEIFSYLDDGFDAVPLSVIEDIKAEIKGEMSNPVELAKNRALYWVLEIIDKHISGKEKE